MTLRERIARKLHAQFGTGGYLYEDGASVWLSGADTILAEMREATKSMAQYGQWEAENCIKEDPCGKAGLHVWQTMINAAIAERDA